MKSNFSSNFIPKYLCLLSEKKIQYKTLKFFTELIVYALYNLFESSTIDA